MNWIFGSSTSSSSSHANSSPFENAKALLANAVKSRREGDLETSLDFYQQSLTILLQLCKATDGKDPNKQLYLETAQSNMTEAEQVKKLIEERKRTIMIDPVIAEALAAPTTDPESSLSKPVAKRAQSPRATQPLPPNPTSAAKKRAAPPLLPDNHDFSNRSTVSSTARKPATPASRVTGATVGKAGVSTGKTPSRPTSVSRAGTDGKAAATSNGSEKKSSEHAAQILDELMDKSPGVRWDDIAGLSFAKQTLQEAVILPNLRPDLFTGLRAPPKGVLLFGPPGTGKTLLAKAVATESGFSFFSITASSVMSKYLGEGEKLMRALFDVAREKQPSVIFFDEIDALMSARKDNEHESSRRLKTEFMTQLDGATSSSSDRILVMGATNLPWDLDEAVLRRMVKRIYVPLPDAESRLSLITHMLRKQGPSGQHLTPSQLQTIVQLTEGYSGSDLAAVCQEAALGPIREIALDRLKTVKAEDVRNIQLQDFTQALRVIRPSVSGDSLQQFQKWSEQFGVTR